VNVWRGQAERLADSLSKGDGSWSPSGGDFDDQPPF
jgi:hypothetical protein